MLSTVWRHRLGNDLFRLANLVARAHELRRPFVLCGLPAELRAYPFLAANADVPLRVGDDGRIAPLAFGPGTTETSTNTTEPHQIRERGHAYHSLPAPAPGASVVYRGFFQSPRYFQESSDTIWLLLFHFALSADDQHTLWEAKTPLWSPEVCLCAVHVSREDHFDNDAHGPLQQAYYERATSFIVQHVSGFWCGHVKFVFFSDDLPFVRRELVPALKRVADAKLGSTPCVKAPEFVCYDGALSPLMQMHLMSHMPFCITDISTFSWWAAWLGKAHNFVVAPRTWFEPDDVCTADDMCPRDDVFPPAWHLV